MTEIRIGREGPQQGARRPGSRLTGRLTINLTAWLVASLLAPAAHGRQISPPGDSTRSVSFETREGTAMNLDVSPDGRTIVFDLLGDLYSIPIAGGEATRLTTGPSLDAEPVFSPDGRSIAFVSDRGGVANLWMMNPDGTNVRQVTKETQGGVTEPQWLTGSDFLLIGRKGDGYWFFRADGTGTSITPFLPEGAQVTADAAWSSDGSVAYAAGWGGISRIDLPGKLVQPLSQRRPAGFRLRLTPDGRFLAYGARLENKTGLRILEVATGTSRWLRYPLPERDNSAGRTGLESSMPRFAFTPDNRSLVIATGGAFERIDLETGSRTPISFHAMVEQTLAPGIQPSIVLGAAGASGADPRDAQVIEGSGDLIFAAAGRIWRRTSPGAVRRLVEFPPDSSGPMVESQPAVSPDGKTVAFTTWNDVDGGRLWSVPATGGRPTRLTKLRGVYRNPTWSPDGSSLVAVREDDRVSRWGAPDRLAGQVYLIVTNGQSQRRLIGSDAADRAVPLADGKTVAVIWRPGPGPRNEPPKGGPAVLGYSLATGAVDTVATLPSGVGEIVVAPDGRSLVYQQGADLYWAAITPVKGLPSGPARVSTPVWTAVKLGSAAAEIRWSRDGKTVRWIRKGSLISQPVPATASEGVPKPDSMALGFSLPDAVPSGSIALEGATLITMNGDQVISDGVVVVADGRITAVGHRGTVAIPQGAKRIDVAGKTIIPGLIDLRGGLTMAPGYLEGTNPGLGASLALGTTTMLVIPENPAAIDSALQYARLVGAGSMLGPRLLIAGTIGEVANPDAARAELEALRGKGVVAGRVSGSKSRDQRQWLAAAARAQKFPLLGEAGDLFEALAFALDGYRLLLGALPNVPLYPDALRFLAMSGIGYAPSLLVAPGGSRAEDGTGSADDYFVERIDISQDPILRRFGLASTQATWRLPEDYLFDEPGREAARLEALGTPIVTATGGKRAGLGIHWEIWALELGGMGRLAALQAATARAARALGLENEIGTIAVGRRADLVVLDGDPLVDLKNTRTPRYVMRDGVLYQSDNLATVWPLSTAPAAIDGRATVSSTGGSR